ncbi:MAG: FISUMP domain-containing protein [Bacteroidota bacterium]
MKSFLVITLILTSFLLFAQEEDKLVDARDGQEYKIITLDIPLVGGVSVSRTWMSENLNYAADGSYCYTNEPAYCKKYGRLYTYASAREACPEGWRIPTYKDWNTLALKYGGMANAADELILGGTSGMNLLLGGFGDPGEVFKNIAISGNYWETETQNENTSGLITIQSDTEIVYHGLIGAFHRNSVRCIKEYEIDGE